MSFVADSSPEIDGLVRALCEAGEAERAATAALEHFGPAVYSFLGGFMRSPSGADDAFSRFSENLWLGLPDFEWRCSLRAWVFTLARRAALSHARRADQQPDRNLGLSGVQEVAHRIRTETAPFRKTEVKDRMRALRERLDPEEQIILVLRVDKGLSWPEVCRVLAGEDEDDAALKKSAARARKRFQLIKEKLRAWATEDGLIPSEED